MKSKLSFREDLMPKVFEDVAFVLGHGAEKHGERSWENGIGFDTNSNLLALVSHAMERRNGVMKDRDSGLNPLLHVACRALMQYALDMEADQMEKAYLNSYKPPRKLVYLASPFSCKTSNKRMKSRIESQREKQISQIASGLVEDYGDKYTFILPITQSYRLCELNPKLKCSFEDWKTDDLFYISKCDEVWVVKMDGWDKSVGVREEVEYARLLGKTIKSLEV